MQKIIIDTNVFISSLISLNYPHLILQEAISSEKIQICISPDLIKEYYTVLRRKKFSKYPDFVSNGEFIISEIESIASSFSPTFIPSLISDKDDNKLLALAQECKADFLITGNTNDFTMEIFESTRILTPKEYWEKHLNSG